MSWQRVSALILRYILLYRRNLARLLDLLFWPVTELAVWGFVTIYLIQESVTLPLFVSFFLGAIIFWNLLFRANLGVAVNFLEDMWTRNLLNLFASPLRPREFLTAIISTSFLQVLATFIILFLLALIFYSFNVFSIGPALLAFFLNLLVMGWSIGLVTIAIILRFGQSAEIMAWALIVFFQPLAAVFYPVSVLPPVFQAMARFVPASHVFEGMRTVLTTGVFSVPEFVWATGLNVVYAIGAVILFSLVFRTARRQGRLTRLWQ